MTLNEIFKNTTYDGTLFSEESKAYVESKISHKTIRGSEVPYITCEIRKLLSCFGNVADFFKEIWVFPIIARNLLTVRPDTNGRTRCIAVRFQLFLSVR